MKTSNSFTSFPIETRVHRPMNHLDSKPRQVFTVRTTSNKNQRKNHDGPVLVYNDENSSNKENAGVSHKNNKRNGTTPTSSTLRPSFRSPFSILKQNDVSNLTETGDGGVHQKRSKLSGVKKEQESSVTKPHFTFSNSGRTTNADAPPKSEKLASHDIESSFPSTSSLNQHQYEAAKISSSYDIMFPLLPQGRSSSPRPESLSRATAVAAIPNTIMEKVAPTIHQPHKSTGQLGLKLLGVDEEKVMNEHETNLFNKPPMFRSPPSSLTQVNSQEGFNHKFEPDYMLPHFKPNDEPGEYTPVTFEQAVLAAPDTGHLTSYAATTQSLDDDSNTAFSLKCRKNGKFHPKSRRAGSGLKKRGEFFSTTKRYQKSALGIFFQVNQRQGDCIYRDNCHFHPSVLQDGNADEIEEEEEEEEEEKETSDFHFCDVQDGFLAYDEMK